MRITEELVLEAALNWATNTQRNATMVSATALEQIATLKSTFTGEDYMDELRKLYQQYCKA